MSQTERSWATIETLLADNTAAAIGATDHRDGLASLMGYGGLVLTAAGAPAVISSVGTSFVLVDVFDQISAQSSDVNTAGTSGTLSPTYGLTVGSTGIYRLEWWASLSLSATNKLVTLRPHITGTAIDVELPRYVASSGDTGAAAASTIVSITAASVVDLRVKIDSSTSNITFAGAGLSVSRVG
jgi:hypothetical protein